MDFGLNEDQEAFRAAVRAFAREKAGAGVPRSGPSRSASRGTCTARWPAFGVFGLLAGEPFNPLDQEDFVAAGLVVEELAYADFNLANAAIPALLMSSLIARHGQESGPAGMAAPGWSTERSTSRWA